MISNHHLSVTKTAHYSTYGTLHKHKTQYIWIVFHGYGQLAQHVIRKFDFLSTDEHFVIAPEGLNHFYWHEGERRPVSNWMTSKDRYHEINDFVRYIDQLYTMYCSHTSRQVKVICLGFSQGVATLWRWIYASMPRVDYTISWGGMLPDDIDLSYYEEKLVSVKNFMIYGSEDHFLTDQALAQARELVTGHKLDVTEITYKGEHRIYREVLSVWVDEHLI